VPEHPELVVELVFTTSSWEWDNSAQCRLSADDSAPPIQRRAIQHRRFSAGRFSTGRFSASQFSDGRFSASLNDLD
ncbi:Hypothetical protein FKW44_004652, partial [Caligus rogercresseyi]